VQLKHSLRLSAVSQRETMLTTDYRQKLDELKPCEDKRAYGPVPEYSPQTSLKKADHFIDYSKSRTTILSSVRRSWICADNVRFHPLAVTDKTYIMTTNGRYRF